MNKIFTLAISLLLLLSAHLASAQIPARILPKPSSTPLTISTLTPNPSLYLSPEQDYKEFQVQKDLIDQVVTYNLLYLGICVTVILFLGGIGYYFNVKHLEDRIKAQETSSRQLIRGMEKETGKQFALVIATQEVNLKRSEEDLKNEILTLKSELEKLQKDAVEEMKKKIEVIEEGADSRIKTMELVKEWDDHYLWHLYKIYSNELYVLILYKEKSIKYNFSIADDKMWLSAVKDALNNIITTREELSDMQSRVSRLEEVLKTIPEHKEEKAEIERMIKQVKEIKLIP